MENRLEDYKMMKFIGILLVVLGHSTHMYTTGWVYEMKVESNFFSFLTKYIYSFHMPLFVFISGGIYYYLKIENDKYSDCIKFINKKIDRLLKPYIIIALLYYLPIRFLLGLENKNILKNIILANDPGYLWYIIMIFNIDIIFY